jgi:multidrug efflux pump subunit AcrB
MSGAIAWFARNSVAANVMMALLVLGGAFSLPQMRQEIFPSIELDIISVSVSHPGASPSEVEEAICTRIEQALRGMQGVKRTRSSAAEGHGSVVVELLAGEDTTRRLNDIRGRVDRIDTFPKAAKAPVVTLGELRFQVLDVAVSGSVDEATLKRWGQRTRDEIAALPGISDVELVAARPYEVSIELSEESLHRYGLTFDEVAGAVSRSSLDLPGGTLHTAGGDILLRTRGQAYSARDFEAIPLVARTDGTQLKLGDVARVIDGFRESDQRTRFDDEPAVLVQVFRVGDQSAIAIADEVRSYLARAQRSLPEGVSMTLAQDDSRFLRSRLDTLTRNARSGFALVLLVLALFLRLRLAFWVSLGVPISFLGAFWMLPSLDVSINLISLMGFIVVLGIVVDDAIVVGENAHAEQSKTPDRLKAAIEGARGVATPVTFGVLTTVAAFAPMLFVEGPMGRIARVVPIVVCACLFFSLVESLLVLPAHLGHIGGDDLEPRSALNRRWLALQDRIADALTRLIENVYRPALDRVLEWRYLALAGGLALMLITSGLVGGGWIRFVFQPNIDSDVMVAYVTMPQGTSVEVTSDAIDQLANAARAVGAEHAERDGASPFAHITTSVGHQPFRIRQASGPAGFEDANQSGAHLGEVQIEVAPEETRSAEVGELVRQWRDRSGQVAGAEELSFNASLMNAGKALDLQLTGRDLTALRGAAADLKARLAQYPGVIDLTDSFRGGKQELELALLPSAAASGIRLEDLARQVRQAFYGHEVQRIQRGPDDVRVMVRFPAERRRSLSDLQNMRIRTAEGTAVPFGAVAHATLGDGYSKIKRVDGQRVVSVTGGVDQSVANANEIVSNLTREHLPSLEARYPAVQFSFEGEQREQSDFLNSLGRGYAMAILAIYALLAVPLRSYVQPFIIMGAIPFGLLGAVWGHVVMGHDLSMFSVIGLVALSGVVVNDSLVLVDWINRERKRGTALHAAIREAGAARFRAVMLTSLTTFAGLSPLLFERSVQAQMLIPMAISLAFGVAAATVITLFVVPASFQIVEDGLALLQRGRRSLRRAETEQGVSTA